MLVTSSLCCQTKICLLKHVKSLNDDKCVYKLQFIMFSYLHKLLTNVSSLCGCSRSASNVSLGQLEVWSCLIDTILLHEWQPMARPCDHFSYFSSLSLYRRKDLLAYGNLQLKKKYCRIVYSFTISQTQ